MEVINTKLWNIWHIKNAFRKNVILFIKKINNQDFKIELKDAGEYLIDFNEMVKNDDRVENIILPLRDGLNIIIKN